MSRVRFAIFLMLSFPAWTFAENDKPLLLQKPTISRTQVAFSYAGDLWIADRTGGDAHQLTSGVGLETDPKFSPDGKYIAFTGQYDGNYDVYVVPTAGGVPVRLTYHPGADMVVGWTPDGKSVLFRSDRSSSSRYSQLFTVPMTGGFPTAVPLPGAVQGSYSPDGKHMAYVPFWNQTGSPDFFIAWKRYRGGKASPIWIANLADGAIRKIPRDKSNDFNPMWVGDEIYFLSDRNGPVTLFCFDPKSGKVTQCVENHDLDLKSACAGPDHTIVYEQFGKLCLFDLASGKARPISIRVAGDLAAVRPHFKDVSKEIRKGRLSPSGARAVFEARGEIFTIPAKKGSIRNLTHTPGVAERDPAWSPNGRWIACFSDESGEYQLHLLPQNGMGTVQKISLGHAPSFYYSPVWSPDSKKLAYTDKRLNWWRLDLATGKSTKIDTNTYNEGPPDPPAWSPDSRWLVYAKQLKSFMHAIFVYSLDTGRTHQITDGLSDASTPVFDASGKYIYFTASTDDGPTLGMEMSGIDHSVSRNVYVIVLSNKEPSPLAPESDEEKILAEEKKAKQPATTTGKKATDKKAGDKPIKVRIDLADIDQRILALPIAARNYAGLLAGKKETLFLLEAPSSAFEARESGGPTRILHRFDLAKRKTEKVLEGISGASLSADGDKLLYHRGPSWFVVSTAGSIKSGEGALKLDRMEMRIDPPAEWRQMYHEVWRIERDFLYDPGFHGLDLKAAEKRYRPYIDAVASRHDLNYVFDEMLGELTLGHVFVGGGDRPEVKGPRNGLLGADYRIEHDRYRFARVYRGENWNPKLRAPLTEPGARVKTGEYLLAVDGRELHGTDNVYSFFEGMADRQVVLKVGPDPTGKGARDVTVVPISSEASLRSRAWIEDNRRKVDRLTGGRVAYIYLPDTHLGGFTYFNRYFFAQAGKEAAIIDERFNGGGLLADHVIHYLSRPLTNYITTREGSDMTTPVSGIFGPKVMIINESAGSGGDAMPYLFRQAKIGKLIGTRTWGGLVGIGGYPSLLDGGMVTAPHMAIWFPNGKWDVENRGVSPDIEVEDDPQTVRAGHDPQLEKAVEVVLAELKKHPPHRPKRPAYPDYHHHGRQSTAGALNK